MNCDTLRRRLLLDDPDARFDESAREHLAGCRQCREALPEVVWLTTASAEIPDPLRTFVAPRPRRSAPRTLTAAAAVLFAVAIVVFDRACEPPATAPPPAATPAVQDTLPEGRRQPLASLHPSFERTRVLVRDGVRIESRLDLRRLSPLTRTGD